MPNMVRLGGDFIARAPGWRSPCLFLFGLAACSGEGGGASPFGGSAAGSGGAGTPGTAGQPSTTATGGSSGGSAPMRPPPSSSTALTRVARLTHEQYQNTASALLGISDTPADEFAPDALNGFAFDSSVDYLVDARLGPQYRAAAEALAELAVTQDAVFARLVSCDPAAASCAGEFIASFGERAFRRPLNPAEVGRFSALFARGTELVGSGDAFRDGVRLVVEAALQSPQFLYRTELSSATNANGQVTLDAWEIASRLSYLAWNSMPDAELFTLSRSGALSDEVLVESAVRRLLQDGRSTRKLVSFHEQVWQFARFSKIAPDASTYPLAPVDMATLVSAASRRFVEEVIASGGGLREFLTAPYAFADPGLAPLYGKSTSSGLSKLDFTNGERQGFLMQVGFLASNAYAIKTDPIHRGLFVLRDLLCRHVAEPPPGASTTPPPATPVPPKTTREEVSALTEQTGCKVCHAQINPPGYAFEGFDAIGRVRMEEGGVPVDTSGTITLDGANVSFADAHALVQALATSAEARACYARKWLLFAHGRNLDANDEAQVSSLATESIPVKDLVTRIATSSAMLRRLPNEVAP